MLSSGTSLLAHSARSGRARIVLSFAGQAQTYFEDLERLYEVPSARRVIEACAEAVADELAQGQDEASTHMVSTSSVGSMTQRLAHLNQFWQTASHHNL